MTINMHRFPEWCFRLATYLIYKQKIPLIISLIITLDACPTLIIPQSEVNISPWGCRKMRLSSILGLSENAIAQGYFKEIVVEATEMLRAFDKNNTPSVYQTWFYVLVLEKKPGFWHIIHLCLVLINCYFGYNYIHRFIENWQNKPFWLLL